jgi:hypothetical protein
LTVKDNDLERAIAHYRADYESYFGKPCTHFCCPILGRDEDVEMCRGHLVALGSDNLWVPQRKDVDNFYGSVVEADLATIVEDRGEDPWVLLLDPKRSKRHKFRMEVGGEAVQHYIARSDHDRAPGHTFVQIRDENNRSLCNIGIKVSPDDLPDSEYRLEVIVERDFRPSVIASMLKAAHLTMFRLLGYDHVDSPGGRYISDILKNFFESHDGSHSVTEEEVELYFRRYESMVTPLWIGDNDLRGTAEDNLLISCWGMSAGPFAIGVVVKVKQEYFCVFLPTDCGKTINTYFSFLKEPPKFVTTRMIKFCDGSDGQGTRWETSEKTRQIPLNHEMPSKPEC